MSNTGPAITLPDDLTSCHALLEQLAGTIDGLNRKNEELRLACKELLQQAFRRRSERYIDNPDQMKLDFGASDDVSDAVEGLSQAVEEAGVVVQEHTRRPRKPRNETFPEHFKQAVLEDSVIGTDDTPVTLLLPKDIPKPTDGDAKSQRIYDVFTRAAANGKPSIAARMWAYRGVSVPLNVFDFTVSWHRDGPDAFLENFHGKLMADCYSGYQAIALRSNGSIQRGACLSHARRKVFDAREVYPLESSVVLAKVQQLYDIEDRAKTLSSDKRLALRQAEAVPTWTSLGEWLDGDAAARVLPKGKFGEALGYLRNHWEPLQLYLTDGLMPIDNNDVEQLMKQVARGRKNWLFIGSVAAGERAADLITLVSSAVRNDLDVWAYVKDVLDQLLSGATDYDSLRPDAWKQSHPDSIRTCRAKERRDRADRKQRRRAQRRITRPGQAESL